MASDTQSMRAVTGWAALGIELLTVTPIICSIAVSITIYPISAFLLTVALRIQIIFGALHTLGLRNAFNS